MAKDPDLDKKHEEDMKIALQERSGAFERGVLLSEVTGRGRLDIDMLAEDGEEYSGPSGAWQVQCHHILGRKPPKGLKDMHPIIQEFWPHIPPLCVLLTTAEHQHADRNTKMMKPLLLLWNLVRYGGEIWQGRPYWQWLLESPSLEELRELPIKEWLQEEPFRGWL